MRTLQEYKPETSPHELLGHLCDRVLSGELATFESLRAYTDTLPDTAQVRAVMKRAFELHRRLDWGFFKDLNPEAFPKLWTELVVQDRRYPFAGSLKRLISISEIYLGLLDIHGYTEFCRKNRNNISVLDRLDRMLQEDLPKIASASGVLCRRAQGDEILLLGASAPGLLKAVLDIMACFTGESASGAASPATDRLRVNAFLPEFAISAGVSGGQKYTPLVITRDGDISGDIVNTAARLQARAGKISPERNKILVTGPVYQKLKAEGSEALALMGIDFLSSGKVEFKGVSLTVYDTVFIGAESFRLSYRDAMERLYESLGQATWKSKVFEDALELIVRIVSAFPAIASGQGAAGGHSCQEYLERVKHAQGYFNGDRYEQAVACLGELVADLSATSGMDELALDYLRGVLKSYQALVRKFDEHLNEEMDEHLDTVFGQKERENYVTLRRNHAMFERLRDAARQSIKNRRAIWQRVADVEAPELSFVIQSLK